jgi:hypothetical protein
MKGKEEGKEKSEQREESEEEKFTSILKDVSDKLYGTQDSPISVIAEREAALIARAQREGVNVELLLDPSKLVQVSRDRERKRMQQITENKTTSSLRKAHEHRQEKV